MSSLQKHKFSMSDMNVMFECPRKWVFSKRNMLQTYVPQGDSMIFGSAVHSAISSYYTISASITRSVEIETRAKESFYSNPILNDYYNNNRSIFDNVLNRFVTFEKMRLATWKRYQPTLVEKHLSNDVFVGIPDAYFQEDRTVIDWKTYDTVSLSERELLQSAIYRVLLEDNGFPVSRFLFVYLSSGRTVVAPNTSRGFVLQQADRMRSIVSSGTYNPVYGPHCKVCPYVVPCNFFNRSLWDEEE